MIRRNFSEVRRHKPDIFQWANEIINVYAGKKIFRNILWSIAFSSLILIY